MVWNILTKVGKIPRTASGNIPSNTPLVLLLENGWREWHPQLFQLVVEVAVGPWGLVGRLELLYKEFMVHGMRGGMSWHMVLLVFIQYVDYITERGRRFPSR